MFDFKCSKNSLRIKSGDSRERSLGGKVLIFIGRLLNVIAP